MLLFERCIVIVPKPEARFLFSNLSAGPLVQHHTDCHHVFVPYSKAGTTAMDPLRKTAIFIQLHFPRVQVRARGCLGRRCHAQKPTTKSKCRTSSHRARCVPTTWMSARRSVRLQSARRSPLLRKNAIQVDLKTCILAPDLQIKQTPPCSVKQNLLLFSALRYPLPIPPTAMPATVHLHKRAHSFSRRGGNKADILKTRMDTRAVIAVRVPPTHFLRRS